MQRNNLFPSYQQIAGSIDKASEAVMERVYELLGLPNPRHYNTWLEDVLLEEGETFMVNIMFFDYPDTSWICVDGRFTKFADLPRESERIPFVGHEIILYIDKRSQKLGVAAFYSEDMDTTPPIRFSKPQVLPFAGEFGLAGNFQGSILSFPNVNNLYMGAFADEVIAPEATIIFSLASCDASKAKEVQLLPYKNDIILKNCTPTSYTNTRGGECTVSFVNCNFAFLEEYRSGNLQEIYTIDSDNLRLVELDGTFQFVRAPKLSRLSTDSPTTLTAIEALFDSSILNNPQGDRYIALAVRKETPEQTTLPQPLEAKKAQLIALGWTITINWKTNV